MSGRTSHFYRFGKENVPQASEIPLQPTSYRCKEANKLHVPAFIHVFFLLLLCFSVPPSRIYAQCSLCRDMTAGSAPRARGALRRAIPVLGIPALTVFGGILLFAYIQRNSFKDETPENTDQHARENDAKPFVE